MYIFPKSNLAYIHIPKCGGTSLKKLLMNTEVCEHNNWLLNSREKMADGNIVDLSHLTLAQIFHYFPDVFEKLLHMSVFTMIRDPKERIFSSIFQSIRMYGDSKAMNTENRTELIRQTDHLLDTVKKHFDNDCNLPYHLVHFNRQRDYVYFQDTQIVNNIFLLDYDVELLRWINMRMNTGHVNLPKENFSQKQSGYLVKTMQQVAKATPRPVKTFLKTRANLSLHKLEKRMARPLDLRGILKDSNNLMGFVDDYYREDLKLYSALI